MNYFSVLILLVIISGCWKQGDFKCRVLNEKFIKEDFPTYSRYVLGSISIDNNTNRRLGYSDYGDTSVFILRFGSHEDLGKIMYRNTSTDKYSEDTISVLFDIGFADEIRDSSSFLKMDRAYIFRFTNENGELVDVTCPCNL